MQIPALRRIDRIGVELEGGWDEEPADEKVFEDGSVYVDAPYPGEIVSRPTRDLEDLSNWISRVYPDHLDHTCGLHVHISVLDKNDMALLAEEHFWFYYLRYMESWASHITNKIDKEKLVGRLTGDAFANRTNYCRRIFISARQLDEDEYDRYTQLNFCAWHKFKTLEFRVLPMFVSLRRSIRGIFKIVRCVESYLNGVTATGRIAREQFEAALKNLEYEPDLNQEELIILPTMNVESIGDTELMAGTL